MKKYHSMAKQHGKDLSKRLPMSAKSAEMQFHLRGESISLKKELLAAKSAKLAVLFREKSDEEVYHFLQDIVTDPISFEVVARFCYGLEMHFSAESIVPVICLGYNLEMTESHCANNLLSKALTFFRQSILPSWNGTITAFCIKENNLKQAIHLGLHNACIESVTSKALLDPRLLGEPIKSPTCDSNGVEDGDNNQPFVRRRLFVPDWKSLSLTTLPLPLYVSIVEAMNNSAVPSEYVAGSLYRYVKRWAVVSPREDECISIFNKNSRREIIETVERLLPDKRGALPCIQLFEMLQLATGLEASADCRNGFEVRIGKQLDQARVDDLLIYSQRNANEMQYDVECLRRILKHFYTNYIFPDSSGLIKVAELIEQYLAEVACDVNLKRETFIFIAEMSIAASSGIPRNSDGIYRAINIYLEKHRYLTESEREELCQVLDCNKLSPEACQHAAKNDKLPMRVVVQVLFVGQLQLRDAIMKDVQDSEDNMPKEEVETGNEAIMDSSGEVRTEMVKMNEKVKDLEKECYIMRKKMHSGCSGTLRKEKPSIWSVMKRKFGCTGSTTDYSYEKMKKKKKHFK